MPLSPGDKLGPYEILVKIGAGGMGEVYRAHDPRLRRDVAIKVSAERFSERFEREAHAVAALNHPNICSIYDIGPNYLVMELVEGESPKGPLPLDTALDYARQIAEALDEAHGKGIVHRDLKPANIKITPAGVVKVLDFGLAKQTQPSPVSDGSASQSPTLSMAATQAGMILGTAAYMSPEQARGKQVDKRADIWAFAVVLYEMLMGQRLFRGEDVVEILAAVVNATPDVSAAPPQTRRLLERCLVKDPRKRLRDIGDAMGLVEPEGAPVAAQARSRFGAVGWVAALLLGAVALWAWMRPVPPESKQVTRFTVPWDTAGAPYPVGIALSRDGSKMAYTAGAKIQIFVRAMDSLEVRAIPGTEGGQYPAFSPNGDWIVFTSGDQLKKIPVAGGSAQTLVSGVGQFGGFWGTDDKILFGTNKGLMRIGAGGGAPEKLLGVEAHLEKGEIDAVFLLPQLLPGGKAILYHVGKSSGKLITAVLDLTTRKPKIIQELKAFARYVASGYLVFREEGGSLMAAPFDESRLELTGPPVLVMEGAGAALAGLEAFSETGTLAYYDVRGDNLVKNLLVWVDRKGVEQVIQARPERYYGPRISPDGKHIAMLVVDERTRGNDVWVYDLPNGPLTRRTFDRGSFHGWTPDGKRLIVTDRSSRSIVSIPFDGSGAPRVLVEASANSPSDISPDGKFLIGLTGGSNDVLLWPVKEKAVQGNEAQPYPNGIMNTSSRKSGFRFSPDGRWVAYISAESGRPEVFVVPYPGPGAKSQVSIDGGAAPRWSRDGRELFFMNGTKLMATTVETSPTFKVLNTPKMLFDYPGYLDTAEYDVSPDGQRFLMAKNAPVQPGQQQSGQIQVVLNWFEELRRRVPTGK